MRRLMSFMPASSPSAMSSHPVCGSSHHAPRRPNTNTQPRRHALAPAVSTRDAGSPSTPKCSPSPARAVSGPSDVQERREPPSTPESVFAGQASRIASACTSGRIGRTSRSVSRSECGPPRRFSAIRNKPYRAVGTFAATGNDTQRFRTSCALTVPYDLAFYSPVDSLRGLSFGGTTAARQSD